MSKRKGTTTYEAFREVNDTITSSTDVLTLNDDCLYKIFDWLSLEELACVNSTCKRLQMVSGDYFEREYQLMKLTITRPRYEDHIKYVPDEEQFPYVKQFKSHFRTVNLEGGNMDVFRHAAMLFRNKSIKHLYLDDFCENEADHTTYGFRAKYERQHGEIIKDILRNVETLQTNAYYNVDSFHEIFFKHCSRSENLIINRSGNDGFVNTLGFFNQTYPTLRRFLIKISLEASENLWKDLQRFVEKNAKLEVLFYFEEGRRCKNLIPLIQSHDFKVKELALRLFPCVFDSGETTILLTQNCKILNQLMDKKNYKKLQLIFGHKQVLISAAHALQSLKNLQKVYMLPCDFHVKYDHSKEEDLCDQSISILSTLVQIETLLISKLKRPEHAEMLAKGLLNLNEIFIDSENIDVLLPFVQYSPNLTMIYLFDHHGNFLYPQKNPKNFNMNTLIKERNKLSDATPLKIYVHRNLFVNMKRPATFSNNLSVEMKRIESFSLKNPAILDAIIGTGYAEFY